MVLTLTSDDDCRLIVMTHSITGFTVVPVEFSFVNTQFVVHSCPWSSVSAITSAFLLLRNIFMLSVLRRFGGRQLDLSVPFSLISRLYNSPSDTM